MGLLGDRTGKRSAGRIGLAVLMAGAGLGCGAEEAGGGRVAAMVATAVEADGASVLEGPPRIESIAFEPARPVAGGRLRARARVENPGGRKTGVEYRWQTASGRELGRGPELDTKGLEAGTVVEVVATPSLGDEAGEAHVQRVRLASPASQLALVVIDAPEGRRVGSRLRAFVETTDEDAGFDEFELEWRVAGDVVGTDAELDTAPFQPGDVVELRAWLAEAAADGGRRGRPVNAVPTVLEPSLAPEIVSEPGSGLAGGLFRYAVRASSPSAGAKLRFELRKGPEGMKVDPATGVVEWRPAPDQRGRYEVEVAVLDQWGSGIAQVFAIGAEPPAPPPASPR